MKIGDLLTIVVLTVIGYYAYKVFAGRSFLAASGPANPVQNVLSASETIALGGVDPASGYPVLIDSGTGLPI